MKHLSRKEMKEVKGGNWVIIGCQVKCQRVEDLPFLVPFFIAPVQDCTQMSIDMACWGGGYAPMSETCNCVSMPID